ncbi:MAG: hypothetical protein GC154_00530 [bacterium]|nr:hypothetical protein [bacterium]
MNDEMGFHLHQGDEGDDFRVLKNPCVADCNTEIGRVTLILDREYPRMLFVQINEEWRKCIMLDEEYARFRDDMEVHDFLVRFQSTGMFNQLIEEEKKLDEGWKAL